MIVRPFRALNLLVRAERKSENADSKIADSVGISVVTGERPLPIRLSGVGVVDADKAGIELGVQDEELADPS